MFSPPKAANAVAANPFNFGAFSSGGGQPAQKVRSGWAYAAKPPPPPVPPSGFATSGSHGANGKVGSHSASNSDEIGLLSDLQRRSLESSVRVWAAGDLLAEGCARFQLQHSAAAHSSSSSSSSSDGHYATTPTLTPSSGSGGAVAVPPAPPLESFARAADQPPAIAASMPHFVMPPEHGGNPARALLCFQMAPRALNARSSVQPVGPGARPAPMPGFVGAPLWPQLGNDGASLASAAADAVGVTGLAEPAAAAAVGAAVGAAAGAAAGASVKLSNQNIGAYVQAAQAAARTGTPEEQALAAQSIDATLVQPVMARVAANIDALGGLGGGGVMGDTVEESLLQNVRQWEFVEEQLLDPTAKLTSAEVQLPAHHLATSLELMGKYYLLRGDSHRAAQALERSCPLLELLPPRQLPLGSTNGVGISTIGVPPPGKVAPDAAGAGVGAAGSSSTSPSPSAAPSSSSSSRSSKTDRRFGGPALSFAPDSGKCFDLLVDVYRHQYDEDGGVGLPRWPLTLDELSTEAAHATTRASAAAAAVGATAAVAGSLGRNSESAPPVSRKPPPPPTALLPDQDSISQKSSNSSAVNNATAAAAVASADSADGEGRSSKKRRKRSKGSTTDTADVVATLDSEGSPAPPSSLSSSLDREVAAKLDALREPYQHLRGVKKKCDTCDEASPAKGRRSSRSARRAIKNSIGRKTLGRSGASGRDEERNGRDQLDLLAERFAGALLGPTRARNSGNGGGVSSGSGSSGGSMVAESAQRESRRRAIDSADTILRLAEATVSQLGSRGSTTDDSSSGSDSSSSSSGRGAPMCDEYLRVMRRMLLAEEADFDLRFAQPSQPTGASSGASREVGSPLLQYYGGYRYPAPVRPDLSTALLATMERSEVDHTDEGVDGSSSSERSNTNSRASSSSSSVVPALVSQRFSTMATSFGDAAFLDIGTFGDVSDGRCYACFDGSSPERTTSTSRSNECCSADGSSVGVASKGHALGRAAVKVVAEEVVISGHLWLLAQQQLVPLPNHSLAEEPAGLPDLSAVVGEGQAKEDIAAAREAARQLSNFMEEYVPGADLAAPVFTLLPPVIRLEIASVFGEAVAKSSAAAALAAAVSAKEAAVAATHFSRDDDDDQGYGSSGLSSGSGGGGSYGADAYVNDLRRERILDGGSEAPPLLFSPFDQAAAERRRRGLLGRWWDGGCAIAGLNPQRTQPAQLAGALVSGGAAATWTPAILAPGLEAIAAQRELPPHSATHGRHYHRDSAGYFLDGAATTTDRRGDSGSSPFWAWMAHLFAVGFVNWLSGDGFFGALRLMLWRVVATCVVLECVALTAQACVFGILHNALTAVLSVRREFLEAAGYLPSGSSGYSGSDGLLFGDDGSGGRYSNSGRREKGSKRRGDYKSSHHRNNSSSSSSFGHSRSTSVDDGAFLNGSLGDSDAHSNRGAYYGSSGSGGGNAGSLIARAEAWMPPPVQSLWWSLTKMALRRAGYAHLIPVPKPKPAPVPPPAPSPVPSQPQAPPPASTDTGAAAEPEDEVEDLSESSEQSESESDTEASAMASGASKSGKKLTSTGTQAAASLRQGARAKASNDKVGAAASSTGKSKEPLDKQNPNGLPAAATASFSLLEEVSAAAVVNTESAWQPAVKRKERGAAPSGTPTSAQSLAGASGLSSTNGKAERSSSSSRSSRSSNNSKGGSASTGSAGVRSGGAQSNVRPLQPSPTTKAAPGGNTTGSGGRMASPRSAAIPPTSSVAPSAVNAVAGGWAGVLFKAPASASPASNAAAGAQPTSSPAAAAAAVSDPNSSSVTSSISPPTPVRRSSGSGNQGAKSSPIAADPTFAPPPGLSVKPSPKANSKKATAAAAAANSSTTAPDRDPFAPRPVTGATNTDAATSNGVKSAVERTSSSSSSSSSDSAPVLQHVSAHPQGRKGTDSADGLELDMWFELERSIEAAASPHPRHPANVTTSTPPGLSSTHLEASPTSSAADPSILFDLGLGSTLSGSGHSGGGGGGGGLFDSTFAGASGSRLFDDASSFAGGGLGGLDNFGAALLSGGGLGASSLASMGMGSGGLGGDVLTNSDESNLQSRAVSARSRRTFASDESASSELPPGILQNGRNRPK